MAVEFSELLISPPLQYVFVDQTLPNTVSQLAAGASVFFFEPDKITPKNIYIATGDPMNAFIVATNPQITNAAGRLEQPIYLYLFDEADALPTTEQLYYIRVVNTLNVIIDEYNDWPQNETPGGTTTSTSLTNLAPDYGFDVLYRPLYYGGVEDVFIIEVASSPALGYVWVIGDPTNGDFFYRFTEPAIGTLTGDPLHLITLTQENFGTAQTSLFFAFPICQFQELIGSTLTFQFIAQDQSTIAVTNLDIGIVRAPNALSTTNLIDWSAVTTPINVGSVTLSTSLEDKSLSFTVPDLVITPDPSSATYITISLPLDQNFVIALTGCYVYQGEGETVSIARDNLGNRYSRVFTQAMANFLLSEGIDDSTGLPLMRDGQGGAINYQNRTGNFIQLPGSALPNFAVPATGRNVVNNYTYAEGSLSDQSQATVGEQVFANRYVDQFFGTVGQLANNSFLITSETATGFDIQTVLAHSSYTNWVSNSGVLVIVGSGGSSAHTVTAAIQPGNPERVNLTFTANYFALTFGYDATPTPGFDEYSSFPAQNVLVNWFGTITGSGNVLQVAFNIFPGGMGQGTISNGSAGSAAEGFITFPVGGMTASEVRTTQNNLQTYGQHWTQYTNCLQFLDTTTSGATFLPLIPPNGIQFHVNNNGGTMQVSDTLLTVNFTTAELASGATMASVMVAQLGGSTLYTFTFSGIPANGETFFFSSTYKSFIGIFFVTNQLKPTNLIPTRPAIYIEIAPGASIQDVVDATTQALQQQIAGIPSPKNLGISVGTDLALFMEN